MGMTTVRSRLANVHDKRRAADVDMTADAGAIYSVVPATILRSIGVQSERTETFWLADGGASSVGSHTSSSTSRTARASPG